MPGGVTRDRAAWRFIIRGSLLPLALIMAIFWTRYGLGILAVMSPATIADPVFMIVISYWLGLCSGFFPARTIRIFNAALA